MKRHNGPTKNDYLLLLGQIVLFVAACGVCGTALFIVVVLLLTRHATP